ncbi:YGGT family protein [bacterium BMS3Abin01]|nr:YGGT family protein [bacterium BMS3Abin01]HDY69997.1 YggT family protein [Actinomycetota bacterium]
MTGFDARSFVNALFYTYYVFIIIRIVFSWTGIPSNRTLLILFRYVHDVTEPYLGLFRRFIPLAGPIDFSPFVGLLVLGIIQSFVVSAL